MRLDLRLIVFLATVCSFLVGLSATQVSSRALDDEVRRADESQCELHVWTTSNINAANVDHTFILAPGGSIGQSVWTEPTVQGRMERLLTSDVQREILEGSELVSHPVLKSRKLVWHAEPSPQRNWTDKKEMSVWPRHAGSDAACYSELHYGYITFLDQPGKDVLQTGWFLRHFENQELPVRWGWAGGYEKSKRSVWTNEGSVEEAYQVA